MEKQHQEFSSASRSENSSDLNMEKCPYYNGCSQNFCPLDPDTYLRSGKKQDWCRFMREPKQAKIQGREFVSGGTVMPDALLNLVPRGNLDRLNKASRTRLNDLMKMKNNEKASN